jgi:hypothetical protein
MYLADSTRKWDDDVRTLSPIPTVLLVLTSNAVFTELFLQSYPAVYS